MRFMVKSLEKFTIANISKQLNEINPEISLSHHKPFPNLNLLSHYEFKKRPLKILPNGDIEGGFAKMLSSLIDFSVTVHGVYRSHPCLYSWYGMVILYHKT